MSKRSIRLFVGLPVNDAVRSLQTKLQADLKTSKGIRWVAPENLHVTTCFIGERNPEEVSRIQMLIRHISQGTNAISLRAETVCLKPKRDPYMIWLLFRQNENFTHLVHRLDKALLGRISRSEVLPHCTLARYNMKRIGRELEKIEGEREMELPIDSIILYESILLPDGARYHQLDENNLLP